MAERQADPRVPPRWSERWYELLLAGRLLRSRRSVHLSLVTSMSVAGIALGVAALIVVLAVNTGFQAAFQDRILATYPHLVVMRRGVDLHDWREVQRRLERAPSVRSVTPATYDDMMLSAAMGRAGAVVRGVPLESLAQLPEGALVAGRLDERGELPQLRLDATGLQVQSGVVGARHVLVTGGPATARWVRTVAVLPLPEGLGGVVVFDADGCTEPRAANKASSDGVFLAESERAEPVRRAERGACRTVASWDAGTGRYHLRYSHQGERHELELELVDGQTTLVVLQGSRALAVPPPRELAPTLAGVAVAHLGAEALPLRLPDGATATVTGVSPWSGFVAELPAIALGEGLARRLQVTPGDEVRAVSPLRGIDRLGDTAAGSASGRFRVAAVLRTGFHDHDQRLALVDFRAAQRFLGRGDIARWVEVRVTDPIVAANQVEAFRAALEPTELYDLLDGVQNLRIRLHDLQKEPQPGLELRAPVDAVAAVDNLVSGLRVARQARTRGGGAYRVVDWEEMNRNIFDAARMQKIAMSLFPFIIVLVAALNVVGTQAVVVHERAREIAILRAMGATRRSVAAVFLVQGLTVGLAGTVIGLGVGGLACLLLDAVGYPLDPQVYLISRLPVLIEPAAFVVAGGAAVILAFAAAWLSAQRAASRPPVDALRRLD